VLNILVLKNFNVKKICIKILVLKHFSVKMRSHFTTFCKVSPLWSYSYFNIRWPICLELFLNSLLNGAIPFVPYLLRYLLRNSLSFLNLSFQPEYNRENGFRTFVHLNGFVLFLSSSNHAALGNKLNILGIVKFSGCLTSGCIRRARAFWKWVVPLKILVIKTLFPECYKKCQKSATVREYFRDKYCAYHQIVTFWDFLGNFQKLSTKNTTKLEDSANRYGFWKYYRNDLVVGTVVFLAVFSWKLAKKSQNVTVREWVLYNKRFLEQKIVVKNRRKIVLYKKIFLVYKIRLKKRCHTKYIPFRRKACS